MPIFEFIVSERKKHGLPMNLYIRGGKDFFKQLSVEFAFLENLKIPEKMRSVSYVGIKIIKDYRLKSYKICKN